MLVFIVTASAPSAELKFNVVTAPLRTMLSVAAFVIPRPKLTPSVVTAPVSVKSSVPFEPMSVIVE